MKITADTNVLISASFWFGNPLRIIRYAEEGKIELVLSKEILGEFEDIIGKEDKFGLKLKGIGKTVGDVIAKMASISRMVETQGSLNVITEDPDDNRILECATAGRADYIVSGDNHLLNLREYKGIKIVTPSRMLEIIKEEIPPK